MAQTALNLGDNTPKPTFGVFRWWRNWVRPRATNRDEAFRESTIRVTVAILLTATILSFLASLPFFDLQGGLVSYPMLTLLAAVLTLASGIAVARHALNTAGRFLVLTFIVAASGITIIDGYWASLVLPMYMLVVLITALVLPRSSLLPISWVSIILFGVIAVLQEDAGRQLKILIEEEIVVAATDVIINVAFLVTIQALFLRQLRIEFDSRLAAMSASVQQAEQAKQEADRANRAKSEFLAGMSHEFRTPLNAIIGYVDIMLSGMAGAFSEKQTQLQTHIKHNASRLLGMINDTLDMAKIEANRLEMHLSQFSPEEELRQIAESMKSLTDKKQIELNVLTLPDLPPVVTGDLQKTQQIFTNLLGNAIKFTSQGGVAVYIGRKDAERWMFKVVDTGIGIPEEAFDQIFEMFQRVEQGSAKYEGTGLGLAISKRLVDFLGGEISVMSRQRAGSTFTVILPCEVKEPELVSW